MVSTSIDIDALVDWFAQIKRPFPWRSNPTPYRVWISEVMLQQTRASVAIDYFNRWMARFPNITALATASLEDVIKLWEGLGYYTRARNLYKTAQIVLQQYAGELPSDPIALGSLPGLGPYTIGAIRALAFHQRAAAVDGNVIRVLSRHFAIAEDIAKPATQRKLTALALALLPEQQEQPWLVTEALIELGATVCGKQPQCGRCPLRASCQGYSQNIAHTLPYKSSKGKTEQLFRLAPILMHTEQVLVRKIPPGQIMADLYEFPYLPWQAQPPSVGDMLAALREQGQRHEQGQGQGGSELRYVASLPRQQHSFTHYRVCLYPMLFECSAKQPQFLAGEWLPRNLLPSLPFSSGHRRLLQAFLSHQGDRIMINF